MNQNSVKEQRTQGITKHAQRQLTTRRISDTALSAVMRYGRMVFVRDAKIYVIGRKEVVGRIDQYGTIIFRRCVFVGYQGVA